MPQLATGPQKWVEVKYWTGVMPWGTIFLGLVRESFRRFDILGIFSKIFQYLS